MILEVSRYPVCICFPFNHILITKMSESERTKRKKIREEINVLNSVYSHSGSNFKHDVLLIHCISNEDSAMNQIKPQLETNFTPCSSAVEMCEPSALFSSNVVTPPEQLASLSSSINSILVTPSHFSNNTQDFSIKIFLVTWSVQYNIPHNAVNGLLKGLKNIIVLTTYLLTVGLYYKHLLVLLNIFAKLNQDSIIIPD